jgi:hypothetical protein
MGIDGLGSVRSPFEIARTGCAGSTDFSLGFICQPASHAVHPHLPRASTMASTSQRPDRRDGALSTLDAFIQAFSLIKDTCGIPPAQIAFGSAVIVLTLIRVYPPPLCQDKLLIHVVQDTMVNDQEYVDLGLACADVCQALDRGLEGRRLEELTRSVLSAIRQLTT